MRNNISNTVTVQHRKLRWQTCWTG